MAKRKVILDVDTGSDDAIALIAAMANPDFEVLGIMAVNGNRAVPITTENSLRISELMGGTVPVFQGCAVPWTSCMLGFRRHYPMYSAPEEALYKTSMAPTSTSARQLPSRPSRRMRSAGWWIP